jgi:transcription factor S
MMFCPKCGSLLIPKKSKKEIKCSCGYLHKDKETAKIKLSDEIQEEKKIEVMNEEDSIKSMPLTKVDCPNCDSEEARFWTAQTRSADEAETRFFRCEKCHHIWRDAS